MQEQKKTSILLASLHNALRDMAVHASDDRTIILHVHGHPDITIRHQDIASPYNCIGMSATSVIKISDAMPRIIDYTFQPDYLLHLSVRPGQTLGFPFSSIHSYTLTGTVSDSQMMA